jgi:hypothetical protein
LAFKNIQYYFLKLYCEKSYYLNKQKNIIILIIVIVAFAIIKLVAFFKQGHGVRNSDNQNSYRDISHLILTKHAKCRMDCRNITEQEIKEIIHGGNVNYSKSSKGGKGDDTYAIEGYSTEQQHLRIVVAPESDGLVVVTCIDLDNDWSCNCY